MLHRLPLRYSRIIELARKWFQISGSKAVTGKIGLGAELEADAGNVMVTARTRGECWRFEISGEILNR
jgi:hypothetical protein